MGNGTFRACSGGEPINTRLERWMASVSDINAAFESWLDATGESDNPDPESPTLRYRVLGSTRAALETESDYLVLCRIETPPAERGRGDASRVIELLKSICERYNVTLLGQATAYDGEGMSQQSLLAWYERHGFEIDHGRTAQPLVWYPRRPGG